MFFVRWLESFVGTLKKSLTFKGRATRSEYWIFVLFCLIYEIFAAALILLGFLIYYIIGYIFLVFVLLTLLCLCVSGIALSVRRLHDLGLSGFWLWYLNPVGLPVIFMVYLLDLDGASNRVIDKIQKIGSPWLGWILTWLFWPSGATATLLLLFLYAGKNEANEFGPSPYIEQ